MCVCEVQVENYFNILAVDESSFHLFFPPATLFSIIFVKIDYGGKFLGECTELYVLVFFGRREGLLNSFYHVTYKGVTVTFGTSYKYSVWIICEGHWQGMNVILLSLWEIIAFSLHFCVIAVVLVKYLTIEFILFSIAVLQAFWIQMDMHVYCTQIYKHTFKWQYLFV